MNPARRIAGHVTAALIGAVVGGTLVLALDGATRDLEIAREAVVTSPPIVEPGKSAETDPAGNVLLAWSPGGLPARTERVVERVTGVRGATTVRAGLDWLRRSRSADGAVLDAPRHGSWIPIEVAVVDPLEYARYVAPSERAAIQSLRPGRAIIAETEARLRGAGQEMSLRMVGGRMEVTQVVSDVATNGYEVLAVPPVPATWQRVERFVLMRVGEKADRREIQRTIQAVAGSDARLRIRAQGEVPFLRYGDAVLPQLVIKEHFGEFAATPNADGSIDIDPAWRKQNIVTRPVPLLGNVTCHRGLFPQLKDALNTLVGEGLAFTVDAGDFAGCYQPRFIDANPGGRLSHHSWGIAVDLNAAANPAGTRPDQDRRLIDIMEEAGFTWGGRWLIPDGMHFEWVRSP